jgi:hypothetical protein
LRASGFVAAAGAAGHRGRPSVTRARMPSNACLNSMTKLIQNGFKYTFSGAKRHESCIIGNQFYKISYFRPTRLIDGDP